MAKQSSQYFAVDLGLATGHLHRLHRHRMEILYSTFCSVHAFSHSDRSNMLTPTPLGIPWILFTFRSGLNAETSANEGALKCGMEVGSQTQHQYLRIGYFKAVSFRSITAILLPSRAPTIIVPRTRFISG